MERTGASLIYLVLNRDTVDKVKAPAENKAQASEQRTAGERFNSASGNGDGAGVPFGCDSTCQAGVAFLAAGVVLAGLASRAAGL